MRSLCLLVSLLILGAVSSTSAVGIDRVTVPGPGNAADTKGFGSAKRSYRSSEYGNVWVTFNNVADVPVSVGGRLQSTNAEIQKLINQFNIVSVEQAVPSSRQEALQEVYSVTCFCDADVLSARMRNLRSSLYNPEIAPKYELMNDPDDYDITFTQDYALDLIDAKGAWERTTGSQEMVLGIADGNFYTDHEDLETEVIQIAPPWSSPVYYYQHGTAVATTAGGATNNGYGKSSIGWDCKLSLVGMNYNGVLNLSYAGVRVINMSWAAGCYNSSYVQAIVDEVYNNGTILVAAAGNGSTCNGASTGLPYGTALVYPAAHDNVIAVSSVGPWDNHEDVIGDPLSTHQHNSSVDLTAPGYDVALTVAPGWYLYGSGTSFAAPYVTGTIGLMLSVNPCLTPQDVQEILSDTAVNIDAQNPNYIGQLGAGRLDASEAVRIAEELSWGCGVGLPPGPTPPGPTPPGPTPPGPTPPVPGVDESNGGSIWRGEKPERKN